MNKNFLIALAKLQDSVGTIKKDTENPYFKSKYADLNAIFDEVKEKIRANGFILIQNVEGQILRTRLIHIETNEMLESTFDLVTAKPDMQQLGSAVTYARRYSLLPLLNIETEDDDGNLASGNTTKKDFGGMKTVEEFTKAINEAKEVKELGALWYKWKVVFKEDSSEYKQLNKISSDKKLALSNPDLKVGAR